MIAMKINARANSFSIVIFLFFYERIVFMAENSDSKNSVRKIVVYSITVLRLWLGAWMVVNGLNYWLPIFPQPLGSQPLASQLLVTMIETGMFDVAKAVEVIGGLLLLAGRFIPLALAMLLPVSAIVFFNGGILQDRLDVFWFRGLPYMGTMTLYINLILIFAHIRYYLPIFTQRTQPGHISDWKELGKYLK
jgi:uncharacterized membrane protein YphA (DoxX/SURF4 family)